MKKDKTSINKLNIETQNTPEKGPFSFITGSLTSFSLCIFSYFISNNIDKIMPGESKSINKPKSCKDIKK